MSRHTIHKLILLAVAIAILLLIYQSAAGDPYSADRHRMVRSIEAEVRETSVYLDKEALDPRVILAMKAVPRDRFVPAGIRDQAYENRPLPIGHGQTISQPYIVAIMTDMIKPGPGDRVLEIGTGSGYQAAILGQLVDKVYTIEIIRELGEIAAPRLKDLGYHNIVTKIGDGYYGWEDEAPFDSIVVTAAASHIPPPLIKQLKPGGRMIIPVGSRFMAQQLVIVEKETSGNVITRQVLPVRFVPLTGEH